MKIWQKNYDVNKIIEDFTIGKDNLLDMKLAMYDVLGSLAHIAMLKDIHLINETEHSKLHNGLIKIIEDISEDYANQYKKKIIFLIIIVQNEISLFQYGILFSKLNSFPFLFLRNFRNILKLHHIYYN